VTTRSKDTNPFLILNSVALALEATHCAVATFGLDILEDITSPQEQEHDNSTYFSFFEDSQKFLDSESTTVVTTPEFTFCTTTARYETSVDPFFLSDWF
jgi:hypothetical protein